MTEKKPRIIKYGNDFFQEISIPDSDQTFSASYWDLWIAIILETQFDNDIDKMRSDFLATAKKSTSLISNKYEGLLSHISSLHQTLAEEKLNFSDILQNTDADFIKKQKVKAESKIIKMKYQDSEKSTWMINTPRKLYEERAMRGC